MSASAGSVYHVKDYGAVGDGETVDTPALQRAVEACSRAGGGTVYVPAGRYLSGSIFLRSDVTLHLDAGAVIVGSESTADYPLVRERWEGLERETYAALIAGRDLVHVAVVGRGTVDGRGAVWWQGHREKTLAYPRPRLMEFSHCNGVLIEGITLVNSPSWTIHPLCCENVTVDKVTIVNPADSPNTDGINPDSCRHVQISNCHVDVGDDCIACKSGIETAGHANLSPCEDIAITNCTMVHGHGGVVIGSDMSGDVRNVVVANCVFRGTDRGIRLESRRGRGGTVEDVRVTNIVMQDVLCPFTMNLYYNVGVKGNHDIADKRPRPITDGTPRFRRIHFSHVSAQQARAAAGFIYGLAEMPVEDISFGDISVSMAADAAAAKPEMADDVEPVRRAGFFVRNARGLRFHNVEITGQAGPTLELEDVAAVEISATGSTTPDAGAPVIKMKNVDGAFVHGCQAHAGTGIFLQVDGEETRDLVLAGNHLAHAGEPVHIAENVRPGAVTR